MQGDQIIILEKLKSQSTKSMFEEMSLDEVLVFGSVITEEFNEASDVDIAILSEEKVKINDILKLELFLEDLLKRPIDVVDINNEKLDIFIKINILNNGESIYSKDDGKFLQDIIDETEWYYRENEYFFMCRRRELLE